MYITPTVVLNVPVKFEPVTVADSTARVTVALVVGIYDVTLLPTSSCAPQTPSAEEPSPVYTDVESMEFMMYRNAVAEVAAGSTPPETDTRNQPPGNRSIMAEFATADPVPVARACTDTTPFVKSKFA
jgi:hypothetical protein